jgi:hypothetical protein
VLSRSPPSTPTLPGPAWNVDVDVVELDVDDAKDRSSAFR